MTRSVMTALFIVVTVCAFFAEARLKGTGHVKGVEARLPQSAPNVWAHDSRRDFGGRRPSSFSSFPHYDEYLMATAECDDEFRKYSLGWAECIQVKYHAISTEEGQDDDDLGWRWTSRYSYPRGMGSI